MSYHLGAAVHLGREGGGFRYWVQISAEDIREGMRIRGDGIESKANYSPHPRWVVSVLNIEGRDAGHVNLVVGHMGSDKDRVRIFRDAFVWVEVQS